MTEVGTTMRCGPHTPREPARCAKREMVCKVLPRPVGERVCQLNHNDTKTSTNGIPVNFRDSCFEL
jgi:hypothetical protein